MRLTNLQALRGVACLLVLFFHVAEWELRRCESPAICLAAPFEFFGYVGVDLFFVLSGFVITWVSFGKLGDRTHLLGFAWRRAWRILPLYWVTWLGVVLAYHTILELPWLPTWRWFWGNVLILPTQPKYLFIPQAWSLAYELLFYAVFALFFLVPRRVFLPALALWFGAIVACAALSIPPAAERGPIGRNLERLVNPLVLEFLLGCFAAAALRTGRGLHCGRLALMMGVIGFCASAAAEYLGLVQTKVDSLSRVGTFGLASALIVFGATACELSTHRHWPLWLQRIGDASYSIYLVHVAVLEVVHKWWGGIGHDLVPHVLYVVALIGGSLAVGFAVHFAAERPLMRLVRRPKPADTIAAHSRRQAA